MKPSPTLRLLIGLLVTLAAVAVFSWYALEQIHGLERLQSETIDRARRDSLQLLRVQNDLSALGLALHDMVLGEERYGVAAYRNEFLRIRTDLEDAIEKEGHLAPGTRIPEQQRRLRTAIQQFWQTSDQVFQLADAGEEKRALAIAGAQLSAQQSSLSALTFNLLKRNNEAEEAAAAQVAEIHEGVRRNIYAFLAAMLVAIVVTSLYIIYSNRRMFAHLESLSRQRRILAAKLITVQEEVLRSVSRELHDEFGQILTAVGAMLARAERKGLPPDSPFRTEMTEVREIVQATLEKMRSLSQMLHPAVIDDYGLVKALEWYAEVFSRQSGIETRVEVTGEPFRITGPPAINCFRIVQEALTNASKHARTKVAQVRLDFTPKHLMIEIQDSGVGIVQDKRTRKPGLGLIAMQERAELLGGKLHVDRGLSGGTTVTLEVPLPLADRVAEEEFAQEAASPQA